MIWALVLILAVVQGVTEFLPVSSSGHLRVLSAFFGVAEPQTFFDIMLHVGTLVAVFVVYRDVFGRMLLAVGRMVARPARIAQDIRSDPDARLFVFALIATIPTGVMALLLGDHFESWAANLAFVGGALVVNGLILLWLRALTIGRWAARGTRPRRGLTELNLLDALVVGTAQGFGVIRGISRSGSTITAGLVTGLNQEASAAFSFVLSVPAIVAALTLKLGQAELEGDALALSLVGAAVAALVGIVALRFLLALLRRGQLHHFAWYCFGLGCAAIAYQLMT